MTDLFQRLKGCILFSNCRDIGGVLRNIGYCLISYGKGQTVAIEGDECAGLGIIIKGNIEVQKIYASGKAVTIERLGAGEVFGEVIIFSPMRVYPATLVSSEETEIMMIPREDVIKLCRSDAQILSNFMSLLSGKIIMLNRKIKNLSYQTLRQKVAGYLMDVYKEQGKKVLELPVLRKEMAEQLGVARPSLSRELMRMREEGILEFHRNMIKIKDLNLLEDFLLR